MRQRGILLWLAAIGLAVAACGGGTGSGSGTLRLSIATGGTGGVYYPYGGGIAQVLTTHLPNVEATAEVTAASVDNLKFLRQGTSDLALTMADSAQDALAGEGEFKDFGPVPVRTLAVLYSNYMHLATAAGSGIRRLADLRGKVVSVGSPGAGSEVQALRILEAAGIDPERDIRPQYLGASESVAALKDGKLDAFFWSGGLPAAAILDLFNTPGFTARLLPSDEVVPALQAKYGKSLYYSLVIPRTTYGMADDVPVVAVATLLVTTDRMPEQLAYDITRTIFEQQPTLASIHPQARELDVGRATSGTDVPFHPGAIRYYKEQGVWTP